MAEIMPSDNEDGGVVVRMDRTRIPVPKSGKNFDRYISNIEVWRGLCGLAKKEQDIILWYILPDNHISDIKVKIYNEVGVAVLKEEGIVENFITVMNEAFKQEEEVKAYEVFGDLST